jgi:hypothetical protein
MFKHALSDLRVHVEQLFNLEIVQICHALLAKLSHASMLDL